MAEIIETITKGSIQDAIKTATQGSTWGDIRAATGCDDYEEILDAIFKFVFYKKTQNATWYFTEVAFRNPPNFGRTNVASALEEM